MREAFQNWNETQERRLPVQDTELELDRKAIPGVRRPRGRPPKHPGSNQYTGIRAKNIEYVRQMLRHYLDMDKASGAPMNRISVWACRMLLACEGVYLYAPSNLKQAFKTK